MTRKTAYIAVVAAALASTSCATAQTPTIAPPTDPSAGNPNLLSFHLRGLSGIDAAGQSAPRQERWERRTAQPEQATTPGGTSTRQRLLDVLSGRQIQAPTGLATPGQAAEPRKTPEAQPAIRASQPRPEAAAPTPPTTAAPAGRTRQHPRYDMNDLF